MALIIQRAAQSGATADYWRVVFVETDYRARTINVGLAGYVDAGKRSAGLAPLMLETRTITGGDFIPDITRGQAYVALKGTPEFSLAVDHGEVRATKDTP